MSFIIILYHNICQIHLAYFRFSLFHIKLNNKTTSQALDPPQVNRINIGKYIYHHTE